MSGYCPECGNQHCVCGQPAAPSRDRDALENLDKKATSALCACGCGQQLDREGRNSKYRFECKKRIEREQAAKYRKQTREKQAVKNARS